MLEKQWALQRVTAMSAGAEPVDESYDDDDDDDRYLYDRPLYGNDVSETSIADDSALSSPPHDQCF